MTGTMSTLSLRAVGQSSSNSQTTKQRWPKHASFPHGEEGTPLASDGPGHEPYTIRPKGLIGR